jgi:hypothetical protein
MRYLRPSIHLVSCLRTPAERRVDGRFVSAPRLVAGHGAFVEIRAQERHSVREVAHVDADERPLFCPGQLFFTALHAADSPACRGGGSLYAMRAGSISSFRRTRCSVGAGGPLGPSRSRAGRRH